MFADPPAAPLSARAGDPRESAAEAARQNHLSDSRSCLRNGRKSNMLSQSKHDRWRENAVLVESAVCHVLGPEILIRNIQGLIPFSSDVAFPGRVPYRAGQVPQEASISRDAITRSEHQAFQLDPGMPVRAAGSDDRKGLLRRLVDRIRILETSDAPAMDRPDAASRKMKSIGMSTCPTPSDT